MHQGLIDSTSNNNNSSFKPIERSRRIHDYGNNEFDKLEKPTYLKSHHNLRRIRLIKILILSVCLFSDLFVHGPLRFAKQGFFFTVWSEVLVLVTLILGQILPPLTKTKSFVLVTMQHTAVTVQVLVVGIFWGVLFPALGISFGSSKDDPNFDFLVFTNVYKHTLPFLCM